MKLLLLLAFVSLPALADPTDELKCLSDSPPARLVRCRPDHSWHVLVITQGGAVSLIKDLTKEEAEHTAAKLKGQPYTPEEKAEAAKQAAHEAAELAKCKADEKKQSQGSQGMLVFTCGSSMIWATQGSDLRSVEVFQ